MKCHGMCFPLWLSLAELGLGAPDPIPFVGEFGTFLSFLGKCHCQHGVVHPGEEPSACFPLELGNRTEGG